jgi:hypothetical protein
LFQRFDSGIVNRMRAKFGPVRQENSASFIMRAEKQERVKSSRGSWTAELSHRRDFLVRKLGPLDAKIGTTHFAFDDSKETRIAAEVRALDVRARDSFLDRGKKVRFSRLIRTDHRRHPCIDGHADVGIKRPVEQFPRQRFRRVMVFAKIVVIERLVEPNEDRFKQHIDRNLAESAHQRRTGIIAKFLKPRKRTFTLYGGQRFFGGAHI